MTAQKPSLKDLGDAIDHADIDGVGWDLNDFSLTFLGNLSLDDIGQYDDLSSWLELDPRDFRGLSVKDKARELAGFRGMEWAQRSLEWLRTGIPPIVVIEYPDPEEGVPTTVIGDGRGRTNFAAAFGLTIPTWKLTHKSLVESMKTTLRELKLLIQESVSRTLVKDIRAAFFTYIKDNDPSKLEEMLPTLLKLQDEGELSDLLDVGDYDFVYRLVDVNTEGQLKSILELDKVEKEKYGSKKSGVLHPYNGELSSWTVNPRSLVYSGFFAVAKKPIFILFRAKVSKKNKFLGNPDALAGSLDVGDGYSLERETLGVGDIVYDRAVYGFRKKDQSSEGLMMDLINKVSALDDLEFTNDYYFPEKL